MVHCEVLNGPIETIYVSFLPIRHSPRLSVNSNKYEAILFFEVATKIDSVWRNHGYALHTQVLKWICFSIPIIHAYECAERSYELSTICIPVPYSYHSHYFRTCSCHSSIVTAVISIISGRRGVCVLQLIEITGSQQRLLAITQFVNLFSLR